MDLIRMRLNQLFNENLFFQDKELIEEVQNLERKIYPIFLTFGTKTDKHPPCIVFNKKIESVFRASKKKEVPITLRETARIMTLVQHAQEKGHVHFKCFLDVDYLKYLGIQSPVFFYFKFIYREYCETDAADNPLSKKLNLILESYPKDFFLIRSYIQKLVDAYGKIRFILPECYASLQEFGFQKKMCFNYITDQIKDSYFCDNCGNWANHISKASDSTSRKKMSSYTPHECAQRLDNDKIVCLKSNTRNRTSSENSRLSKTKCSLQSLVNVNMIGVIQKAKNNKLYCKCWICDCIFELKPSNYGHLGITCGNDHLVKKIQTNRNNEKDKWYPCFYCSNNIYARTHTIKTLGEKITVIDDTQKIPLIRGVKKYSIKEIGLCNLHYIYFQEMSRQSPVPLLSRILEKLIQKSELKIKRSAHKIE